MAPVTQADPYVPAFIVLGVSLGAGAFNLSQRRNIHRATNTDRVGI
jgi:hypothetical protein